MDFKEHITINYGLNFYELLISELRETPKRAGFLNTEKCTFDQLVCRFPHLKKHPYIDEAFLYDKDEYPLGRVWQHEAGVYYLQDPSAMMVATLLPLTENDIVLDLCAAPGGKTIQASLKMHNRGIIVANDISYSRALILSQNVERMGRGNIIVTNNNPKTLWPKYANTFSKIILDAPCSGSGMFRKNAAMQDDWSYDKVLKCAAMQKELIVLAYDLLKPGGILSYSTCSYSPEENEDVVNFLLKERDAQVLPLKTNERSTRLPGAQLFVSDDFGEGQFICQVQKPGILAMTTPTYKNTPSLEQVLKSYQLSGQGYCHGGELFMTPMSFSIDKLKIIRHGLKIGKFVGPSFMPDYHLAHYLSSVQSIKLDAKERDLYLAGEVINKNIPNGFQVVSFDSINLGFVKSVNGVLKNHYPKGLRIR